MFRITHNENRLDSENPNDHNTQVIELNSYFQSWQSGRISDAEMAVRFFLFNHEAKYPNKKLKQALVDQVELESVLNHFVFKKVKAKALIALKKWFAGEWNFKLVSKILSPYEVLALQAQGIRPVTIKLQENFAPILHKEDCLEFFIHDLEHGHMFFFDEELKTMQINFFRNVEASFSTRIWDKYLGDKSFEERLFYLISDMNTHEEHYRSYLHAMLEPQDIPEFEFIFKER